MKVATIGDIIQVVKLERVVEELKEEIWELDTNNKFVLFIYYQHVTNKAVSLMRKQSLPSFIIDPPPKEQLGLLRDP